MCGKIGHYVRECPVDKANKEKAQRQQQQDARKSSSDTGPDSMGGYNQHDAANQFAQRRKSSRTSQSSDDGSHGRRGGTPIAQDACGPGTGAASKFPGGMPIPTNGGSGIEDDKRPRRYVSDQRRKTPPSNSQELKTKQGLQSSPATPPRPQQATPPHNMASPQSKTPTTPPTPKVGQSLNMKELFAMAGGSPVSLGSLGSGSLPSSSASTPGRPLVACKESSPPGQSLAQQIAHIGSLSSPYSMETRDRMFDAPLMAPPTTAPNPDVMPGIQLTSPDRYTRRSNQSADWLPPVSNLQSRAAIQAIRSLDEVALESGSAVGLDSNELSFRELITAKLHPTPRPRQNSHGESGIHSSPSNETSPLSESMVDKSPSSFNLTSSSLGVDPLSTIWSPIPEPSWSWTPSAIIPPTATDTGDRRRYSREDLLQLRSFSPRASASALSSLPAVGTNVDDVFGLGHLFLPSSEPTSNVSYASYEATSPRARPFFPSQAGGFPISPSQVQNQMSLTDDIKSAMRTNELQQHQSQQQHAPASTQRLIARPAVASAAAMYRYMEGSSPLGIQPLTSSRAAPHPTSQRAAPIPTSPPGRLPTSPQAHIPEDRSHILRIPYNPNS